MSGHSKWHNIQGRKGKQDAKRSNLFSKFAKKISIAAKTGGGNPEANFSLRLAIDKAKQIGMPKDNIERSIKSGTGELKEGAPVEELMYEAFGPGGTAILIKVLTDNKNRTAPEIRRIVADRGGNFGGAGSVQWMFEQWGVVRISNSKFLISNLDKDGFELRLIEAGAEDISNKEGGMEIKTKAENLKKVVDALKELNLAPESSGIEWIAKDKVPVTPEAREKLIRLFEALDEHDDVEDYFTNAE